MYRQIETPLLAAGIGALLLLAACSDTLSGSDDSEADVETRMVEDLYAPFDRNADAHEYVLFSLSKGEVITEEQATSTNWDIGFAGTDIILNSGVNGPGDAGAILLDVPFDQVTIAPSEGYEIDTEEGNAISGWYSYT